MYALFEACAPKEEASLLQRARASHPRRGWGRRRRSRRSARASEHAARLAFCPAANVPVLPAGLCGASPRRYPLRRDRWSAPGAPQARASGARESRPSRAAQKDAPASKDDRAGAREPIAVALGDDGSLLIGNGAPGFTVILSPNRCKSALDRQEEDLP